MNQERVAIFIVGITAGWVILKFVRRTLAPALAQWMLNRGWVKQAFWVRRYLASSSSKCSNCK